MVLISSAIVTKTKTVLCRQFFPISKSRIDSLLTNFRTALSASELSHVEFQRTKNCIEGPDVRYLFLPLDTLYLVLVTDLGSNPVTDGDTLKTIHQVLTDVCSPLTISEEIVKDKCFEIIFAFDEIVSLGGHREESVTISHVREFLLMESAEEKVQLMYRKAKEETETENRKQRAQELDKERLKRLEAEKAFAKIAAQAAKFDSIIPASTLMMTQQVTTYGSDVVQSSSSSISNGRVNGAQSPGVISHVVDGGPKKGMKLSKKQIIV